MPNRISIPPGVVSDSPPNVATGRWLTADKVMFRGGALQNMRGWSLAFLEKVSGVARKVLRWSLLNGGEVTAVATHKKLYIYRSGKRYDITPIRASGALDTDPFSTANGSGVVTVSHVAHALEVGDTAIFSGATAVGGIDPNGEWTVSEVVDTSAFKFVHTSVATSDATGGGSAATYAYEIHVGPVDSSPGSGWGSSGWGSGTWGSSATSDVVVPARTWSLQAWGEDLLACPIGGNIYWWDATSGVQTRAALIAEAPQNNLGIVVSEEDRHLIVYGAGGDPLAIQWPNQGTLTDWAPGETSTADTRRLLSGSRVITAAKLGTEIVLHTDSSLYSLQYIGTDTSSHSLTRIPGAATIMGPNAGAQIGNMRCWIGNGQFYAYNGSIQVLECPLANTIVDLMNVNEAAKITAGANFVTGEFIFFWPSGTENDHYVKVLPQEGSWDIGTLDRTAWFELGENASPIAAAPDGSIYQHEVNSAGQTVNLTLRCHKYPQSTPRDVGPFAITSATKFIRPRARGRYVSMKVEGTVNGNGQPESWSAETGPFSIGEGDQVMFIDKIVPDISFKRNVVRIGDFSFDAWPDGDQ